MRSLMVGLGFVGLLVAAWAVVTQPLLSTPPIRDDLPTVDPLKLEAHVRTLAEKIFPRDAGHPQNLDRAAAYVRQSLEQARGSVTEQPFEVNGTTYRNVIARFGPDTMERIVVGAHYDTAGQQPGSDDNASGVAGLLELANLLGNATLETRVDLVAYTLEEPPFFRTEQMGSAVHARSLKQQNVHVRAMISLEMIGYFSDAPGSQRFPSFLVEPFYPSRGNFIALVGKLGQGGVVRRVKRAMRAASALPVYSINAPVFIPGVDFSDHLNYWDAGYDAVMVTDTAFYRNTRYHTNEDTPGTLDYHRMAMVVQGAYAAVLAMAEN